jgi:4,5-DOPA dioxygenase extradiol
MNPRMPALFLGHGSPMNAIESNRYTRAWQALGNELPTPRAMLVVSAHWYTTGTGVTAMGAPRTIHDFYGFPPELYQCQYPAPGDPALAERVQSLLQPTSVVADSEWGLDHGTWSVLMHLFPKAQIPVIQLSVDATLTPRQHYQLAQRLAPLRDEGVLLLGSGNVVHNLRRMSRVAGAPPAGWAVEFNEAVRAALMGNDHDSLIDYARHGAAAAASVPTPEHYLPLLYVLALQGTGEQVALPVDGIEMGSISMLSVLLGDAHSTPQKQ